MMQQYMKELEQEPFNAEEFVERLAWRTIAETKSDGYEGDFNPTLLHESFVQALKDLTLLQERQQKKCEKLEGVVHDDEAMFFQEIYNLLEQNKQAIDTFQELDGKINHVATKVLHLGDQLDSVNGPRARVVDAQRLLIHLSEFLSNGPLLSSIFSDPYRIDEAADIIQKLYLISQDLPSPKFETVKRKIERKYCDIEKSLIEEFANAIVNEDLKRMKEIATVLSQFKGYSQCIDAYIDQSQAGCLLSKDVFGHLLPLCKYNYEIIKKVFNNHEQVMAKFVLNIYQLKIAEYIDQRLNSKLGSYSYLQTLYELYSKFKDLRRDLQAVIGTRANINIAQIENYGGETFLSEELAIMILQDTKHAFESYQNLKTEQQMLLVLDKLVNSLLIEHVDYAVELGLQAVPVVEGPKSPPHFVLFYYVVLPLVINTPKYNDCIQKKKFVLEDIERKINTGLDRSLIAIATWVKLYLQTDQKKSDFKPDTDDFDTVASPACKAVSQYVSGIIKEIKAKLDGNNVTAVLQELGVRLHRVVYDHMLQFQYNTAGAMVAICDLNEYRLCTKPMGPLVAELF
ncbi:hypothetical protein NQ317_014884 [Molorchus minor]|uniref:Exocyst complex component 5 n=1 Tax=Molorchus minor TaxID=1323400 RepID=A0ABQ9JEC1_9CUCU|nr:hypothetical protein NQ317_014884 [Molorchus minor]